MSTPPHVAVVVGHRKSSRGAVSADRKTTEYDYNMQIARDLVEVLRGRDIEAVVIERPDTVKRGKPPVDQYHQMIDLVNATRAMVTIELHLNSSSNPSASGAETLCSGSESGKRLATHILDCVVETLGIKSRGLKVRSIEQRGGEYLHRTNMPAVIVEPGFVSNDADLQILRETPANYVLALAGGIETYFLGEGALETT